MAIMDDRRPLTRERRSGALSAYHGSLGGLTALMEGETRQAVRTFSQCAPDEIILSLRALGGIRDSVIIVHGGAGCAASALSLPKGEYSRVYSTNLNERDSILGGDYHLRRAIERARAECSPQVIFVLGTPVVAINNDDINSVIMEMDERGSKIVHVTTDGFRSKTAVTGYDAVSHAMMRELIERSDEKEDFVNVISMSESARDAAECVRTLRGLGIRCGTFPLYSSAGRIRRAGRARATAALNDGEGGYLARGLEESFGVKFIPTDVPIGTEAAGRFILAVASEFGAASAAERYISRQAELNAAPIADARLDGARFFLNMDLAAAAGFSEMIGEFGGTVAGLAVPYVDADNRDQLKRLERLTRSEIPVVVANGQPFEIANVLSKVGADYYIGGAGMTAFARRLGVTPISIARGSLYGFGGVREFARLLKAANGARSGVRRERPDIFYKAQWLAKSGNWHVKTEVK